MELTTVADDCAVAFDGTQVHEMFDLAPGTLYELGGESFRTFAPRGELIARFATVNDVHIGETECGVIEGSDVGPVFTTPSGEPPYPEMMSTAVVGEIAAIEPDAVIAKGDLTANGSREQWRRFDEIYDPVEERLWIVRGNHDTGEGGSRGAVPTQEIVLDGLIVALLDTARPGRPGGDLSTAQIEWLDELGHRADRPVMVMGHHPCWNPEVDRWEPHPFGLTPDASLALLGILRRRDAVLGYAAGHTHRNEVGRLHDGGGKPVVQVAAVKDYPGTWAEYRVFDGSLLQVHRRCRAPQALRWTELTRNMYSGTYDEYAFGRLDDRCWMIDHGMG